MTHGHCNMTQTTTIWLELSNLVTILNVVLLIIFSKNEAIIDVVLALLS